jgi:hypothetical protein
VRQSHLQTLWQALGAGANEHPGYWPALGVQLPALALGPAHKSAKSPLVLFPRRAACFHKHNQQLWLELLPSESIEPYGTSSKEACGLSQHLVHY